MSVKKPKVLPRYKSPTVAADPSGDSAPVPRARRKRESFQVPRWLALIPSLFFGAAGVILIGSGILRIALMIFYNLTAGEVVRSGANRELWGQLVLNQENFLLLVWTFLNGAGSFAVGMSWMHDESRRALRMTVALIVFFFLSAWVRMEISGRRSRPAFNAPPPAGGPHVAPGQAPVFPPLPAVQPPAGSSSPGMAVTIFLDHMTDAERSSNDKLLKREFNSLNNYVPGTVHISGNTLIWKARIPPHRITEHKDEAIAILRRNNVRLSEFSEWWLKNHRAGMPPVGPPPMRPSGQPPGGF